MKKFNLRKINALFYNFFTNVKNKKFFNLSLFLLIAIFFILYFPQIFILNENLNTIKVFEVDASLMIDSVLQHLQTYNLQLGYMSQFYGWSYFFVNYIILKPLLIILNILNISLDISLSIFLIRTIFFCISLGSVLALYYLLKTFFKKDEIVPLLGTTLYVLNGLKTKLFVDVKPETTGLLFLFVAILFLLKFIDTNKDKLKKIFLYYILGMFFATLSVLAKQSFVFMFFLIVFLFYWEYTIKFNLKFWQGIINKKTIKIIIFTFVLIVLTIFIVYPHLFRHPLNFLHSQKILLKDHGNSGELVLRGKDLYFKWIETIFNNIFLKISLFSSVISLTVLTFSKKFTYKRLLIIFIISVPFITFLICRNSGLFINPTYLLPMFPIFIFALLFPFFMIKNIKQSFFKLPTLIIYGYLFTFMLLSNLFGIRNDLLERKNYKTSDTWTISKYISQNIPNNSKLAISQEILVPSNDNFSYKTCHWWNNCGSWQQLVNFEPEYLIFNINEEYNNIKPSYYNNYIKYINDYSFQEFYNIGNIRFFRKSISD